MFSLHGNYGMLFTFYLGNTETILQYHKQCHNISTRFESVGNACITWFKLQ